MPHLVDSKAGHYINIVAHHPNFNLVRQQKDLKDVASLYSPARVHITTPTGSIPEAPEIRTPPYYGHTVVVQTVSGFERFCH